MKKENPWALIPFVIFMILFIGSGIIMGDFYAFPVIVAISISGAVALAMNRKESFSRKVDIFCQGAGNLNVMLMVIIFLLAGAFSEVAKGMGAVDSTVNFALSVIPQNLVVVGLFIIACFISLSMGTSVGTIVALAPIGVGISDLTELPIALVMAAVVGGSMFGDNLSFISDTTITAVRSQGAQMKDKFKVNFWIVLPAAIITSIILGFMTSGGTAQVEHLSYNWIKIIPYVLVIILALSGMNVFLVLALGIVLAGAVGLADGSYHIMSLIQKIGEGMEGMYEIAFLAILIAGMVEVIKFNGGIDFLLRLVTRRIKSQKGAEFGIAGLVGLTNLSTANNTIAILIAGPLAKNIADQYEIEPRKSASILDIFSCTVQGLLPYGAQFLVAASVAKISPVSILPYSFYPILIGICGMIAIFIGYPKKKKA
ncbi:Na+/H+ antiporter NhaC family protein [Lysinibacillus sp. FSL M8-0216]|uniref:Putative methionine transporter, NhaC family n=1 Tax=Lysinibacillus fusiformis TaxID=28031 RepID=A0A1H9SRG7_9BACI|nr:Na+/H+ antiporter NhaC family protein [Lysinibacillus fusiformis]MCG7437840.1 Na+/H+ antiporter NhaC family protein [Lysinibacillus fusiformis]NOG26720.1 Na+/H+ antiporter NhaC family protein [Lysinibacillus fusiformis]SCX70020.1 putative methionine transporter, NhaC family [Lysinibacillus fusiformis]SCY73781.1 putative methionine transporter, NhaC family [Lysinibacillus fusiformis]SDB59671.1 putative methionine transporter, NhaC family [Lysinibacillus fusiformis]